MALKNSVQAIPLSSIASSTVSGSYQAINSGGLPNPCFLIRITNGSNMAVTISYDGSTDQEYLAAGAILQLSLQANSQPSNFVTNMSKGTIVYVKGTAGTGSVYLSGYYQPVL
jgi:hypothetical protein